MKDKHLEEIVIGALLHDIGKVVQRSDKNPRRARHQEFGKQWFEKLPVQVRNYLGPATQDYILRHHLLPKTDPKYEHLDAAVLGRGDLLLVAEADNLAAGERKEDVDEIQQDFSFELYIPLYSIFNKIGDRSAENAFRAYRAFDLRKQTKEIPFPSSPEPLKPADYRALLQSFEEGLREGPTSDRVQHLLNLLEAVFSFVPSETAFKEGDPRTYPDVSLFDHLKITAAVASCLYQFFRSHGKTPGQLSWEEIADRTERRYLLVAGDFSGVQDFIYTVSYRAALKGLRARSFYLELLLEHAIAELLELFDLSRANVIFAGGGNVFLLVPNTEGAKKVIKSFGERFNRFLLDEHQGRLFFALSWEELNGSSFSGRKEGALSISEAWESVRRKLDEQKAKKFHDLITPSFFVPAADPGSPCDVCQKVTSDLHSQTDPEIGETILLCSSCLSFERMGGDLPAANFVEVSFQSGPSTVRIEDKFYRLTQKPSESHIPRRFSINAYHEDAVPLWVGNYPRRPVDFSEAVKRGVGLPSLGTFRADVDNLGNIFSQGLPPAARTFSRMAALSRLFTLFFKRYINLIAEGHLPENLSFYPVGQRKRELVVVYSGGDDLFVTGAWSDVVEFAIELRRAFKQFVGENPAITLSGGMVMTPPKFPIYRMAFMAGEAEEKAKDHREDGKEKDSASLFGQVMFWDQWEEAIEEILEPLLCIGEFFQGRFRPAFPRGLIYKILALAKIAEEKKKKHPYMVLPLLSYVLSRFQPDLQYREAWKRFVLGALSLELDEQLRWLKMSRGILVWIDYMSRGGEENAASTFARQFD